MPLDTLIALLPLLCAGLVVLGLALDRRLERDFGGDEPGPAPRAVRASVVAALRRAIALRAAPASAPRATAPSTTVSPR